MLDSEGFPIVEEGTVAKLIPIHGKYAAYYASFYGRLVSFKFGRWQVVWSNRNRHYSPGSGKFAEGNLIYRSIRKIGGLQNQFVHRLVALAWLPVGEFWQTQIDHIDGNRFNNRADNLRWCSDSENKRYALAIKRGETIITNLQKVKFYAD